MKRWFAVLAVALFARACASITLSLHLFGHGLAWAEIFRAGALYALADGLLGLVVAMLIAGPLRERSSPVLAAMTFADAVLRVAAGAVILWLPAIAEVPVTIVPLFGAIGAMAAVLGVVAIVLWTVEHHRHAHRHVHGAQALFDPVPIIGLLALAVGTMLIFDPPTSAAELRRVVATAGVVLGASMLASCAGAAMSRSTGVNDTAAL